MSLGRQVQKQRMPDFIRGIYTKKSDAESIMNSMGFTNVEFRPVNSLLPKNTVVSQSVSANERVDVTTHIIIEYSNGIPPEKPPVTIQYTIDDIEPSDKDRTVTFWVSHNEMYTVQLAAGETSVTITLTGKGKQK